MNAIALWITTLIVTGIAVVSYGTGETVEVVLTYLIVAFIFGIVNSVIGNTIRIVAFPLYVLTLGLVSLLVNGLLLLIVDWVSGLLGFGLDVQSFWWGVLGALVLGIVGWFLGLFARPLEGREKDRR